MDIDKYKDKKPFIKKHEDGQSGSGYKWAVHYWNFSGGRFNLYLAATYQYAKIIYKGYLDEFNIQIDRLENPDKNMSIDWTFGFENSSWITLSPPLRQTRLIYQLRRYQILM